MKTLMTIFIALILSATLALAEVETFTLDGSLATGGTVTGSVSFVYTLPSDANVRGLLGNMSYQITAYTVTVAPVYGAMPETITYAPALGQSAELCMGNCVFAQGADTETLRLLDGTHTLQLAWASTGDAGTVGAFVPSASYLMAGNPFDGSFNGMLMVPSMSVNNTVQSVPIPDTFWLFIAGFVLVYCLIRQSKGKAH
jgi:hypothetical protein